LIDLGEVEVEVECVLRYQIDMWMQVEERRMRGREGYGSHPKNAGSNTKVRAASGITR
jgi:hypothetical protein